MANTPCTTVNPAGLKKRKRKGFEILNMHCANCLQLYISLSWCVSVIEVYVFINMGRGRHILLIVHTFVVPGCLSWVLEWSLNCFGKSSGMLDNEVHCLPLILLEPFRVKFPVRFLDFVDVDAVLRDQTEPGHLVWASFFFFGFVKWTVENCLKESVFSIDLLSVIKVWLRERCFYFPKVKCKCTLLDLILITPVPRGRQPNLHTSMRTHTKCTT